MLKENLKEVQENILKACESPEGTGDNIDCCQQDQAGTNVSREI